MIVGILLNGLWQGAVIVAIAYAAARLYTRESASTRYAIWLVALFAIAIVPVLSTIWPLHWPSFDAALRHARPGTIRFTLVAATTLAERATPLATPALIAWLAGTAFALARLAVSAWRIARIRRNAVPLSGYDDVVVSDIVSAPIAAGVKSPVVIVPAAIVKRLSKHEITLIVAHERAHIARQDILVNLVQRAIEAALFFNPWVHVISNNLVHEREAASDDAAVAKTGSLDDYAVCLATVARAIADPGAPIVSPSVLGSRRTLARRIERLVSERMVRGYELNWYATGSAIVIFAAVALGLESCAPAFTDLNGGASRSASSAVAASCANRSSNVQILNASPPDYPAGAHPMRPVLLKVVVTRRGYARSVSLVQSSGDWRADGAAGDAASHSTYIPATSNCHAVSGAYLFRAEFAPNP